MPNLYQVVFDRIYALSKTIPDARIDERSEEWTADRTEYFNQHVILTGTRDTRPFMVEFQSAAPPYGSAALELFMAYRQAKGDITFKAKSAFGLVGAFFSGKLLKNLPAALQPHLSVTCPPEYRADAQRLLQKAEVVEALLQFKWNTILSLEIQDGGGFTLRFPPEFVMHLGEAWLEEQLSLLAHLALMD